jgi:putative endonuclease
MFYVYILKSLKNGSYYVGYSHNPNNRLEEHNTKKVKATRYKIPYRIVYTEEFKTETEARKREYYIKRQKSRKFLEGLLSDDRAPR